MATDASSPFVWTGHQQTGQVGVSVRPGATYRKLSSNFRPTSSSSVGSRAEPSLRVPTDKGGSGTSAQNTKMMSGQQAFVAQSGPNTPPNGTAPGSADPAISSGGTAPNPELPTASVQLASVQVGCQQGQPVLIVPSVDVKFQPPLSSDGLLTWQWEVRFDTDGIAAGTPSLIDTTSRTEQLATGTTDVSLPGVQSSPLLSAPESLDYAYSFRLHITTPLDRESDWVSVPQAVAGC